MTFSHVEIIQFSSFYQITGNTNSYQASTTSIDIYNVRYVKIQSTQRNRKKFCLRIELCGEGKVGQQLLPSMTDLHNLFE